MKRILIVGLGVLSVLLNTPAIATDSPRIEVQRFKVVGSTVFGEWELSNVTQPYEDQALTIEEMQKAADAVTRYYLDHGYLTSRAVLADQTIEQGTVHIRVIEGNLDAIEIRGTRRLSQKYIRDRIQQASLRPLNQEDLENQLRLLKNDPLLSGVDASLKEGEQLGQSQLTVNVTEAKARIATLSIDNYGSDSVGSTRLNTLLGSRNLTGTGDQLLVNYERTTTGGANLWDISYRRFFNAHYGSITFRAAPSYYRVTQPDLKSLNIVGNSMLYEVTARQPLVRQLNQEFALSLGVTHRTGETLLGETLINSNQSSIVRFGQDFLKRDQAGLWLLQSQINLGTSESRVSNPFLTWTGQLQRLQSLGKNHLLMAELGWQLSPNQLPVSQQSSLGGVQSLKGYPQNTVTGDNGIRLSLADQITLGRRSNGESIWQVIPFVEAGTVWNQADNPIQPTHSQLFWSTGLGLSWQPIQKWLLRLDVAIPLTQISGQTQDFEIYFNSNYRF